MILIMHVKRKTPKEEFLVMEGLLPLNELKGIFVKPRDVTGPAKVIIMLGRRDLELKMSSDDSASELFNKLVETLRQETSEQNVVTFSYTDIVPESFLSEDPTIKKIVPEPAKPFKDKKLNNSS